MVLVATKPVFGVPDLTLHVPKSVDLAIETNKNIAISLVTSLDMNHSIKRITQTPKTGFLTSRPILFSYTCTILRTYLQQAGFAYHWKSKIRFLKTDPRLHRLYIFGTITIHI